MKETQSKSYSKLDLSDCKYGEFPETDTVSVFSEDLESDISADEGISLIKSCLKEMGYDNVDLKKELKDCSGQLGEKKQDEEWPTVMDRFQNASPEMDFLSIQINMPCRYWEAEFTL